MRTPIDTYIDDALDLISEEIAGPTIGAEGYTSSRDVDETQTEGITKDYAFNRNSFNAGRSLSDSGEVNIGTDGIKVELVQGIDEPSFQRTLGVAQAAGSGQAIEDAPLLDWTELLRGGIQTALETQVICFAIKGVSRVCTHQLVRTRKAAYHQQGQRGMYHGDHPEYRMPESIWAKPVARAAFLRAIYFAHQAYKTAAEEDVSYQDARFILPEGSTNFILCEYPLPTFIDTYAYRACQMFQWEIVDVFRKMKAVLVEAHPWLEPYVKISCEKTHGALDDERVGGEQGHDRDHSCTYQGHERVEGQCDFPWARESNRTFVPGHLIGRKT